MQKAIKPADRKSTCSICYTAETSDFWRCAKCHNVVHRNCAEVFGLEQRSTEKKIKYESSIYAKIRNFPQIDDPHYSGHLNVWICDACESQTAKKALCHFCSLKDGLLAKIKFQQPEKSSKRKFIEDEEIKRWAHYNCMLKLYGTRPEIDPTDRCFVLNEDLLADAPICKSCGPPCKADLKCSKCQNFYAHSLCINHERSDVKLCATCKPDAPVIRAEASKSSRTSVNKVFKELIKSKEFKEFCRDYREDEEEKETEEENRGVTRHYLSFDQKNNGVTMSFPFAGKDLFKNILGLSTSKNEGIDEELSAESRSVGEEPVHTKTNGIHAEAMDFENAEDLKQRKDESMHNPQTSEEPLKANGKALKTSEMVLEHSNEENEHKTKIIPIEDLGLSSLPKNGTINGNTEHADPILSEDKSSTDKMKDGDTQDVVEEQEDFSIIKKAENLESLITRISHFNCISSKQVLSELQNIYMNSIKNKDVFTRLRLTDKWYEMWDVINNSEDNFLKAYDDKMKKELNEKFSQYVKYRVQSDNWPAIPKSYRKYELLDSLVLSADTETFKEEVQKGLRSKKEHKCCADCACSSLETLGPYLHEKQSWDTKCPGRANNDQKRLNKDLKETYCWGIDYATHNFISLVLPEYEDIDKDYFIEKKLLPAVHLTDTPWDMVSVCKEMIKRSRQGSKIYNKIDGELAKLLIRAVRFVNNFDNKAFRLHSKGYGVVCTSEDGIQPNDLVAEYYGELYTAWRWFEKQDAVKKYLKEKNKKDQLPDFYNIILEKHKDDPEGYDLLIVDPINRGNFVSRFSHSCDPNCGSVPTVARGNYCIAMYCMKQISFGEELTFDYFSVTENEKEYKQAICLCGSKNCRIHYLNLITSRNQSAYLEKNLCFLKRNYLILTSNEPLSGEDYSILEAYAIRGSVLDDCPNWLKKWVALILTFIREEKNQYIDSVFQAKKEIFEAQLRKPLDAESLEHLNRSLEIERMTLEADRVQNLIITVNKIKHAVALILEKAQAKVSSSRPKSTRGGNNAFLTKKSISLDKPERAVSTRSRSKNGKSNVIEAQNSMPEIEDERPVRTRGAASRQKSITELTDTTDGPETAEELKEQEEDRDLETIHSPFSKISLLDICNTLLDSGVIEKHGSQLQQGTPNYASIFSKGKGLIDEAIGIIVTLSLKNDMNTAIKESLLEVLNVIKQFRSDYEARFYVIRKLCLSLSNVLNKMPDMATVDRRGLSDILYFYSVTFTYFTSHNYVSVSSREEAVVRKCDIPDYGRYFEESVVDPQEDAKVIKTENKAYSSSYIWAQMTIWWKQTVEKPEATLSQERRGTVSYPTFTQSFVDPNETKAKPWDYPYGSRENWHRRLIESPGCSWPIFKNIQRHIQTWSFKNDKKMYGTFLLEGAAFGDKFPNFVESVIKVLNKSDEERNKLFYMVNRAYFEKIGYNLPAVVDDLNSEDL